MSLEFKLISNNVQVQPLIVALLWRRRLPFVPSPGASASAVPVPGGLEVEFTGLVFVLLSSRAYRCMRAFQKVRKPLYVKQFHALRTSSDYVLQGG